MVAFQLTSLHDNTIAHQAPLWIKRFFGTVIMSPAWPNPLKQMIVLRRSSIFKLARTTNASRFARLTRRYVCETAIPVVLYLSGEMNVF
jgi:hypothetical protein